MTSYYRWLSGTWMLTIDVKAYKQGAALAGVAPLGLDSHRIITLAQTRHSPALAD